MSADVVATLTGARVLLGATGDRWTRGQLFVDDPRGGRDYCASGACMAAAPTFEAYEASRDLLGEVVGGDVVAWNNAPTTNWLAVAAAFAAAAELARQRAGS